MAQISTKVADAVNADEIDYEGVRAAIEALNIAFPDHSYADNGDGTANVTRTIEGKEVTRQLDPVALVKELRAPFEARYDGTEPLIPTERPIMPWERGAGL